MDAQADAEAMTVSELALPEAIAQARYWVVMADVSGSLNAAECYVLAGMLWAINADVRDVVCSVMTQSADFEEAVRAVPTALPAWPQLHILMCRLNYSHRCRRFWRSIRICTFCFWVRMRRWQRMNACFACQVYVPCKPMPCKNNAHGWRSSLYV